MGVVFDLGIKVADHRHEDEVAAGAPLEALGVQVTELGATVPAGIDPQDRYLRDRTRVAAAAMRLPPAFGLGAASGGGVVFYSRLRGRQDGVTAALRGVLFHEHHHEQLEQHQQSPEQGVGLPRHLTLGAQTPELALQCVEFLAKGGLVDAGHDRWRPVA